MKSDNFQYIDEELKKDKDFIMCCLDINPSVFNMLDKDFQNDLNLFKLCINYMDDKKILKHYSTITDKNFLQWAIQVNDEIFKYIPQNFKKDKEFILIAIQLNPNIYLIIEEEYKKDREIGLLVSKNPNFNKHYKLTTYFSNDKEIIYYSTLCYEPIFKESNFKNDK